MLAIRAERLTRRFGSFTAVSDVSLTIATGSIFGLLGPNGSGKTTIIKMLTGLLAPDEGTAWVDGVDVRSEPDRVRERIGYVSQKFSLYPDLTVAENLRFYGGAYGLSAHSLRRRIDAMVELYRLGPYLNQATATLSGGWKQRLAISCSMLHEPSIVFLDEPTADVDPVARRQLWDVLLDLAGGGVTFFISTHYMDEAERCSHVAYIYRSRLIANGSPQQLGLLPAVQPPGTRYLEISARPVTSALPAVKRMPVVHRATVFGQSIRALVDADCDRSRLQGELESRGIAVTEVRVVMPTLEDAFVALISMHDGRPHA